jgi:hypothetical protein
VSRKYHRLKNKNELCRIFTKNANIGLKRSYGLISTLILFPMTIEFYGTIRRFLSFRNDSGEISRYVSTAKANFVKDSSASLLNDKKSRYLEQHFLSLVAFWRYDRFFTQYSHKKVKSKITLRFNLNKNSRRSIEPRRLLV